ncbi:methyltransferase family protein [Hahella ganghwensis]|uniref:methyltransferase family protein n=1 Tax=Hahella ganghwensis TaxID=286420 RepID=UPI0003811CE7|nr:isoprenylcysteine carboxylmethyltransferase family protein [Hahella ganghwensis]
MRKPSIKSHCLVMLQLAGVALSCWPVGWINRGSAWWLIIAGCGIAFGLTTLAYNKIGNFSIYPEPKTQVKLITNGPYHLVRHPMYTSLMVMMVSIAGYNWHWVNVLGVVCVLLAVTGKALMEERFMTELFPEYRDYAAETPRFIPFVKHKLF